MALPYPEKVRIVEKMRHAAHEIHTAMDHCVLREDPPSSK